MTRLSVFIASSLDGYIATADDGLGWLEAASRPGEDYGYDAFLATVDALAMGRGTYDFIASIDPLPFGGRPVYVFTTRPVAPRDGVTAWSASPQEALHEWSAMGLKRVYVDGGALISSFLGAGMIDDMVLTLVPVLLGSGKPLFHRTDVSTSLTLTDVTSWPSGLTRLSYARS